MPSTKCPQAEDLAAFIDGRLEPEHRSRITEHLLECPSCYEVVSGSGSTLEETVPVAPAPAVVRRFPSRPLLIAAAAALLVFLLGIPLAHRVTSPSDPLSLLATATADARPVEGRISSFQYAPPRAETRGDADSLPYGVLAAAAKIEESVAGREDAASLHARGVADLVVGRLDQAVSLLERAVEGDAKPEYLSDLSAAYLARGRRSDRPDDFVAAYEAAQRALAREPSFAPAAFNRALALEAQGFLPAEAIAAWEGYLKIDRSSPWAAEASRRQAALRETPAPPSARMRRRMLDDAVQSQVHDELARLVLLYPQEARTHAEETLLPAWARAYAGGDRAEIERGVRTIARGLSERGDAWLDELCRAIDTAGDERRLAMARGILALDRARAHYRDGRLDDAARESSAAKDLLADTPGALLAEILEASIDYVRRDFRQGGPDLVEASRYPTIGGRIEWLNGLRAAVSGRPFEARVALSAAAVRLASMGEIENASSVRGFAAQALELLGDEDSSWLERLEAAREIHASGATPQRWHTTIFVLAEAAHRRNANHYAMLLSGGLVERATAEQSAEKAIDALRMRAAAAATIGDYEGAGRDLDEAARWAVRIPDHRAREGVLLFLNRTAAGIYASIDPARALAEGEQALERAETLGDHVRTVEMELQCARLLRRAGETGDAERRLHSALARVERSREEVQEESLRLSFADTAAAVIDELIDLFVADGRNEDALALLVRSRSTELRKRLRIDAPPREALTSQGRSVATLIYAVLEEQTLLWVVDGAVTMHRMPIARKRLDSMIAAYRRSPDEPARAAELYRVLLAPAVDSLPPERPIAIVPDKSLHALPFGALIDRRGQYVIENRPVIVTMTPFGGRGPGRAIENASALVVGNPSIAEKFRRELPPLQGAEQEARLIAAAYADPALLIGAEATKGRFLSALAAHRVVHFAGHGKANDRDSGASALFFAPDRDDGVLYARELGRMPLHNVELMVLGGCRTAEGKSFALEGLSGVARAALGSGVRHVVATLGEIDDAASAHLFGRFHERVAEGRSPADALRAAQIEMIRSGDAAFARPSAWGLMQVMTAGV